jgi:hypothetical protein
MWGATLLTSGAAAFGRLLVVNILPASVLVVFLWLTVRVGAYNVSAPTKPLKFSDVVSVGAKIDTPAVLLLLFTIAVLAAVAQSFQIGFVRLLEGYWGHTRLGLAASRLGVRLQARRLSRLEQMISAAPTHEDLARIANPRASSQLQLGRQRRELRDILRRDSAGIYANEQRNLYPPDRNDILGTRLGNAIRSFERRAGERYGYSTIPVWPRLYPHLSDKLASAYHSSVDALDATVNFCLVFAAVALLSGAAFFNDPALRWVSLPFAVLAILSYRSAVSAGSMQGLFEFVAFDLHRFEMLTSLHHDLPGDVVAEGITAGRLSNFFAYGITPGGASSFLGDVQYNHGATKEENGPAPPVSRWRRRRKSTA